MIDIRQAAVGEPWGRGWRGRRRRNEETGLSGVASFPLGMARWASPAHCSASCTDCAKVSTGKEMHPLEASRALKRVSAHIQMADGAGVCGVRMVADGAQVRMDITTNKEQCQHKETLKGGLVNKKKRSHPVVTGQRAAQRKNSPRQWGRPFSRAPWEICPAISTHPHWGGDCTTTLRWQDVSGKT